MATPAAGAGVRARAARLRAFYRDYTAGLREEDVRRLFRQDAAEAWAVLTRDQEAQDGTSGLRRWAGNVRSFLLGLSSKLSPARRLLFAAALAAALLGALSGGGLAFTYDGTRLSLDWGPWWLLASVAGLVFLLALELVDRVRVRDELEVARQLQGDLLPRTAPELPGWRFAHVYRTANEVGGDYYDFRPLPDGRLALVIGDASGHGMAAGLLMAIANASLHTALDIDPAPERVAELLNRALARTGDRRSFFTAFLALLDPATGELEYLCAGHPYPLLRRASGELEELGCGSFPLGLRPEVGATARRTVLAPGDLLLLYTDGLPEAVDPEDRAFGFAGVTACLGHGGSPATVRDRLLSALDRHRRDRRLADDLSLVVLARDGAGERTAPGHAVPPLPPSLPVA
ncbi:MAG TPA: PP2C family protein-serine/threonine phosphatase [Thermoanaerobaculia bacterium]|nr:PP2C family protein-serine/threonine phosphatase [Thermoanaerobaculia bacterium]